ncbi:unnamed protein product [Orchesella dallaii]|uniref:Uncharacterized protein n=1 Tax=Orchesella dallaii TaxID=48710 RepID=A0ABP1S7A2_9HEXA
MDPYRNWATMVNKVFEQWKVPKLDLMLSQVTSAVKMKKIVTNHWCNTTNQLVSTMCPRQNDMYKNLKVVSLAVGWSSFLLLSISSEVSRSLSTTVLSSRTVSEKSNKEPNLLSNPHTFQSHYLDQANHGQWIIPYEYMLYYKWHQLQQQLNNAGGTRQLGYQQQRQSINENHIIASSNLKNWGLTRELENIYSEFHKIEQPHDVASLDHAENLSVIMDNSYNSLLDPVLQQHEPNGMLTFRTNGKIKRKQKYAKLLLICGLLSLCTVIFQFLASFLLLCFVDKG